MGGVRTKVNVAVFLALAVLLIDLGVTTLVVQPGGGRNVVLDFADASGLAPRADVTMRGVPVGTVSNVTLTPHSAGPTWENWAKAFRNAFDNVQRVAAGRKPLWVIPELQDLF